MIGKTISHYKIIEKLGEGGMGVVYKAEDIKLKRSVALKFLPQYLTSNPESRDRFIHEAQAASALDHPNICNIHEIDEAEDGRQFIAMAYYDGDTLIKNIEHGPLKIREAIDIAINIAQGLVGAHEACIIHRDIKPANIIITKRDEVKIVDFGLAKLGGQINLTKAGSTVGTTSYMSPEQIRGGEVDNSTDIWSLGIVLYEMINGQLPFRGEYEQAIMYSIINEDPEPIMDLRADVPLELERIINKCLDKNPISRYHSAEDLIVALRRLNEDMNNFAHKSAPTTMIFMPGELVIVSGEEPGKSYKMRGDLSSEGSVVTIGRKKLNDGRPYSSHIQIDDCYSTVSRLQAKIISKRGKVYVKNLSKTNCTQVDGKKLDPGEKTELKPGSIIRMGELEMKYKV
jgi:serine/threonine protein kinase